MSAKAIIFTFCLLVFVFFGSSKSEARVSGICSDCHTMHNSQGGSLVSSSVNPYLLNDDCVGCHTGTNTAGGKIPKVYDPTGPVYGNNTLAGGNFYWVLQDATKGHNCLSIPGMSADPNLNDAPGHHGPGSPVNCSVCHSWNVYPPGASGDCASCHSRISSCESCHKPAHHADDSATVVGESGGWYRFLVSSNHPDSLLGVKGIEDPDWEFTVSPSDHNEYNGCANADGRPDNSISHFCGGCHGYFHGTHNSADGNGQSPWLRHPSSIPLPSSGEYALYNTQDGVTVGPYNPLAPVARNPATLSGMSGPTSVVTPGSDQVMCLSCHRAHGSPYPDMLRWDYSSCSSGVANSQCGCFVCHTTKD
ncbi:hypothetical protein G4V39_00410 [Thermosulfuriphilus ammonigenes]|uniref:Uncharacterized protein n=1 Tax=Thermosulfuriphilus ammonigenes TaxID=1936021 RepID=A0A6G7PT75_9BACT|nr:cytochrome c3 family protein [Thermosulfuriphilus ammonigenes]MBA2849205.1 hypothetical protein [Thermosulfuriphilus ammonigenes]QIJ70820.1 hypothetical protein G4V39_00410 [Thermosulfuriphilus ammonigenes]